MTAAAERQAASTSSSGRLPASTTRKPRGSRTLRSIPTDGKLAPPATPVPRAVSAITLTELETHDLHGELLQVGNDQGDRPRGLVPADPRRRDRVGRGGDQLGRAHRDAGGQPDPHWNLCERLLYIDEREQELAGAASDE